MSMYARLYALVFTSTLVLTSCEIALAAASAQSTTTVGAEARIIAGGRSTSDAGITIAPLSRLRITASGRIEMVNACGTALSPRGCDRDAGPRPQQIAPAGALLAVFVDVLGRALTPSFYIGDAALVISPPVPSRLAFGINAAPGTPARGAFTVSAAALIGASASGTDDPRKLAQHLLRRMGFAATPEYTTRMAAAPSAWLAAQLQPDSLNDDESDAFLEPRPTSLTADGNLPDDNVYERRLVQREFTTTRQTQEKLVLHWLDHFSISNNKVQGPDLMGQYEDTLRADALGNFKQLVSDVAKTPAMMYWLDNDGNDGSDPALNPPNENFARELMQLFVMGVTRLNIDGSPMLDSAGKTVPNYLEPDVKALAQALSGFSVETDPTNNDPNTNTQVVFYPDMHTPGPKVLFGTQMADPGTDACVEAAVEILAKHPSTAPFQAKELLMRLVTERPSPAYVAAIARVWAENVDAPDQIARVISAIVAHPEFNASYHSMTKEPVELAISALRMLPGAMQATHDMEDVYGPGSDLIGYNMLENMLQGPYYPKSVFSFYRPGNKRSLINAQSLLSRFSMASSYLDYDDANDNVNTFVNVKTLQERINSTDCDKVADYLLDALLDGGTPDLRASIMTYLGNAPVDATHLRGAAWLIMTSPEFQVN